MAGFFLPDYSHLYKQHMGELVSLLAQRKLVVNLDNGGLHGLDNVARAVEYLQSGKNKGKVVLALTDKQESKL